MNDLKLGTKTFTGIDRVQINKADSSGVVNFMESDDFNSVLGGMGILPYYENPYIQTLGIFLGQYTGNFKTCYFENITRVEGNPQICCANYIAPKQVDVSNVFAYNRLAEVLDFSALTSVASYSFGGGNIEAIILRGNTVPTLAGTANQSANKPTVYVPSAMLSAYNADSSWASLVSTKEWTITALEGTQYENPNWFKS